MRGLGDGALTCTTGLGSASWATRTWTSSFSRGGEVFVGSRSDTGATEGVQDRACTGATFQSTNTKASQTGPLLRRRGMDHGLETAVPEARFRSCAIRACIAAPHVAVPAGIVLGRLGSCLGVCLTPLGHPILTVNGSFGGADSLSAQAAHPLPGPKSQKLRCYQETTPLQKLTNSEIPCCYQSRPSASYRVLSGQSRSCQVVSSREKQKKSLFFCPLCVMERVDDRAHQNADERRTGVCCPIIASVALSRRAFCDGDRSADGRLHYWRR